MATTQNNGALSLLGDALDDDSDALETINLYQLESQSPEILDGQKLQDVYGTAAMPVFEWVKSIQTGERTYNPADQFDQQKAEEYRQLQQTNPELPSVPGIGDVAKDLIAPISGYLAGRVTEAAFDPIVQGMSGSTTENVLSEVGKTLLPRFLEDSTPDLPSNILSDASSKFFSSAKSSPADLGPGMTFVPELANKQAAIASGNESIFNSLKSAGKIGDQNYYNTTQLNNAQASNPGGTFNSTPTTSLNLGDQLKENTYLSGVKESLVGEGAASTWTSAGVNAVVQFGVNVLRGDDPVKAAKSAGAAAIGGAIGSSLGGPIGGFIGSTIGSAVFSRVVCNELRRQGHMSKEMLLDDYRFTREFLSPQTVRGYHVWAIPVVRQLRKGRFIRLFKHLCVHRGNEIAYIYGRRDKPDYLGKVYRQLLEKPSWLIGLFCEASDWSILYKTKEI